ncbi:MAG TPA: lactate utilization protein C [Casimicrobiaceae bacterium]|nr:lactate utilization protein C [Casimicrobiaceae bacterium]
MSTSRDNIMGRVRKALGKPGRDEAALAAAEAYIASHAQGPRPMATGDLVEQFMRRARDMESTVERVGERSAIPSSVARYLDGLRLSPASAMDNPRAGVCWPELADLDWAAAGLAIEARPTTGGDRLAVTGVFCAIAETGTMAIVSGPDTPTGSMLLPETHVALVPAQRIVRSMEDAFALLRQEHPVMPRGVHLVSGPSRTGDIEQTIVLGAHGPYRVHILVV